MTFVFYCAFSLFILLQFTFVTHPFTPPYQHTLLNAFPQVVEVSQTIAGVTEEQSQSDVFQAAILDAVVEQLGVFPQDVVFKPFVYDPESGAVTGEAHY